MLTKRLTRRWLINGLSAIVALLVIVELVAAFLVRSYYYQQVQTSLYTRAVSLSEMLNLYVNQTDFDFEKSARTYMQDFEERDKMEFQVLTASGKILASSTGFLPSSSIPNDYQEAVQNVASGAENAWGVWNGKNAVGQNTFALTMMIPRSDGTMCGAIRYVVALDNVDKQITLVISAMVTFGLAILFFVLLSSSYFVNGMLKSLTEIGAAATKIAEGNYSHRIKKRHDDEIGDLCDTINDMAAQIQKADTLQNEFIASVSHELRTPLTAIKGWSETLREEQDPELMARGLEIISGEADRLSGIVEELLDFSRIQNAKPAPTMEKLDIYAELEETVFLMKDRAAKQGVALSCTEQEPLPTIKGDSDRLRRVFVNILDNAIKYSKEHGVIHVDAAPVIGGVQLVFSDNGIGISAEDLPLVTERFYRVSNARPGSGIGLSVAKDATR